MALIKIQPSAEHISFFYIAIFVSVLFFLSQSELINYENEPQQKFIVSTYTQLPMRFEKNMGQADSETSFLFQNQTMALKLSSDRAIIDIRQPIDASTADQRSITKSATMKFDGANPSIKGEGINKLITKSNYFNGNNPNKWQKDIPNYGKVKYSQLYPGIDLVYYGNNGQLEFDFNISPGTNSEIIELKFDNEVELNKNGDLIIQVGNTPVTLKAPIAYQELNEEDILIEVSYVQNSKTSFGFEVGDYDESLPLIIDPVMVYSSYMPETCEDIALDNEGNIYLVGGSWRVFITKLTPDGTAEIFTTYLNGDLDDFGKAIAVDNNGYIYVTGESQSDNFPTKNALQEDFGGSLWVDGDAFVTKLNSDGSTIIYSTYLGGESADIGRDITVDSEGNAYITGSTWGGFPIYNAYQSAHNEVEDVFVTKIASDGLSFIFSTYLGGSNSYGLGRDEGYGIALDTEKNIYITGSTISDNFPTTVNAYQSKYVRSSAFVSKMNSLGTELIYSTYLSAPYNSNIGGGEVGKSIAVNNAGQAYVAGTTNSPEFPTTGALQTYYAGGLGDLFVTKFSADGSDLIFSTYLGGDGQEGLTEVDIKLDVSGNAYITGATNSTNFPTNQAFQPALNENLDAFVSVIKPDGLSLLFSSYLGGSGYDYGNGIALRNNGNVLVAGAAAPNFPTLSPLNTSGGGFVTEIDLDQNEEMLVVKVMQDSLKHNAQPIPNVEMNIYSVDLTKPEDPFVLVEIQTTDENGFLYLPKSYYEPGDPFLVRTRVASEPTVKSGHEDVDNNIYDLYVDNLHIDNRGKITPAYFEKNINDTTFTYLEHPWIGFNLVVTIEWQATDNYIESLKSAYRNANKYFYDVTNGQACLQKVVIFDDMNNYKNTDVKIHANNTQWASAHAADSGIIDGIFTEDINRYVYLPPVFFGSTSKNINRVFDDPLNPNTHVNYSAFIHELGHYLFGFFDEYLSEDGTLIYPNREKTQPKINFGFMDGDGEPMESEMSAFVTPEYMLTRQYTRRKSLTCWEYFRNKYRITDNPVRVEFRSPQFLGLDANEIVEGPLGNDLGVESLLEIKDKTGPDGGLRLEYLVKDEQGEPRPGVFVGVLKQITRRRIKEGKTVLSGENIGKIKLFSAKPGDKIFLSLTDVRSDYLFHEIIVQPSDAQISKTNIEGTANEVILKKVQGQFKLLSEVKFNSSDYLEYSTRSLSNFNNLPTLQIFQNENTSEELSLILESSRYSTSFTDDIDDEGALCMFKAFDSTGSSFFIPQDLNILELNERSVHLLPSENNIELWLDSKEQKLSKLAILGSNFPAPTSGLPDSVLRASNVFAINQQPITESINAILRIYYDADTLGPSNLYAVTIYKWLNEWQPMLTNVNIELNYASTKIEEPGFYAAYLDLTQSVLLTSIKNEGIIEQNIPKSFELKQNYPNPFNPSTTIEYIIVDPSKVRLTVYDILGNEVAKLVNESQSSGNYKYTFDGSNLSSGVYIVQLKAGISIQAKKMIFLK